MIRLGKRQVKECIMTNKKKAIFLTFIALVVLTFFTIFTIVNWATIKFLFTQMTTGISIVKEYVLSLGLVGVFSISLIIIICFFFPVISSVPIQLASAVSYGLLNGTLHVWLSVFKQIRNTDWEYNVNDFGNEQRHHRRTIFAVRP